MTQRHTRGKNAVFAFLLAAWPVFGAAADSAAVSDTTQDPIEGNLRIARAVAPSAVVVEIYLRYDKGQPPEGLQVERSQPYAGSPRLYDRGNELIREKRPLEQEGFLLAPDTVVTQDRGIHPRFIESIRVRQGHDTVSATPAAFVCGHDGMVLSLKKPLKNAQPIRFDTTAARPLHAVNYVPNGAHWELRVSGVPSSVALRDGTPLVTFAPTTLIVDTSGTAAGLVLNGETHALHGFRSTPASWRRMAAVELERAKGRLRDLAERNLVHVKIRMRSPKKNGMQTYGSWHTSGGRDQNMSATEAHAVGVCLEKGRVLVLAELAAEATARLEQILVYTADAGPREARFVGTLADFGGLIAQLDKPPMKGISLAERDILETRNHLLLKARIAMAGKQRIAHYWHGRLRAFERGYRGEICPKMGYDEQDMFVFTLEGELLALPIAPRRKAVADQEEMWHYEQAPVMPVSVLRPILDKPRDHFDTSNVPLDEKEEGRIAWMGVVLQPLDRELARANGVAEQTSDGMSGALVSYVYEGSPADKEGIKAGMILLRIDAAGQPRPFNVRLDGPSWDEPFPWDRIDELPEEFFDRIPPPWPSADNGFTRTLTELGFGLRYRADFVHGGRELTRTFTVVESPPHYGSAPRAVSDLLGLTVRDLTFEVRRHYQKQESDPGVIVSKVEPGSKAAVAGIKPFELITRLNGRTVDSAEAFGELVRKADEVRLSVERMGRSRQVRIELGN
ncbi:MAG: PDZ domain-containing protein [Chitinivibrionales bacterium]|nr:PDZ domain-containing protein [Chitinivibrionales bacterium]